MRPILLTLWIGGVLTASDVVLPVETGQFVIRDLYFMRPNTDIPELGFIITNESKYQWDVRLRFKIDATCSGKLETFSCEIPMTVYWTDDKPFARTYRETRIPLVGKVAGCKSDSIGVTLLSAENEHYIVDYVSGKLRNLDKERADRERKERVDAERRRQEQARKAAAAAERRRVDAAERRKIQAAQEERKAAESARLQATCAQVYRRTADKKMKDLTVRESKQIEACEALGMYEP